ncbi:MAG: flagellar hook-basal body complex protein FliE [Nitrospiraceae bacterium]
MEPIAIGAKTVASLYDNLSRSITKPGESAGTGSAFAESLKGALADVNAAQNHANQAVDALLTGRTENIHEAMIAMQKADVSFQLMMQVRNKLVAAYDEIQRIQI